MFEMKMKTTKRYEMWEIEIAQIASSRFDTDCLLQIHGSECPSVERADINIINLGNFNHRTCYAISDANGNLVPLIVANDRARRDGKALLEPDFKINYDYGIYNGTPDIEDCICKNVSANINRLPLSCPHCLREDRCPFEVERTPIRVDPQ